MKPDPKTKSELSALLGQFKRDVANRDDSILELFVNEPDVFLTGSETGETAYGPVELRTFFKRIFARPFAYLFDWKSCSFSQYGRVAWVFIEATVRTKGKTTSGKKPYRITAVFKKKSGRWLITHYHGAEPMPRR
jgi:ketosteroid isomerase-like protein